MQVSAAVDLGRDSRKHLEHWQASIRYYSATAETGNTHQGSSFSPDVHGVATISDYCLVVTLIPTKTACVERGETEKKTKRQSSDFPGITEEREPDQTVAVQNRLTLPFRHLCCSPPSGSCFPLSSSSSSLLSSFFPRFSSECFLKLASSTSFLFLLLV